MTDQPDAPTPLTFNDDKGSSRSTWVSGIILVGIVAWMASGFILPSETGDDADGGALEIEPVAVAVEPSEAAPVTLFFQAEGQAQPDRDTAIRAEASGDVEEVLIRKGDEVETGQILARLTSNRAEADLTRAREQLTSAEREFENATALLERGVATVDRETDARTTLASARAQLASAEQALESLAVTAPFAGRVETLTLDEGEFVSAGSDVGRIVDNRPLTVAIQVPQQALGRIKDGQSAQVTFITGETRQGTVTFVGTAASAETRTFLAEIEVANDDRSIPAGISAEIVIPTGEVLAHFVSPSIVSLNADGATGVKTVEDGTVAFHEISVVSAEVDGIWVTGLPDKAELITIGQGFVQDGEPVRAQRRDANGADQ